MSTIRIDEEHKSRLDRLLAHLLLRGKKTTRKALIGTLIDNALKSEGIAEDDDLPPLEADPAWTGLEDTFELGITDLSTNADAYLYGEEPEGE